MTLENSKRLYKHFVETGQQDKADEISKKRPEVKSSGKKEEEKKGKK